MINLANRQSRLREISPALISRNPENPRVFFRPAEMETLMASIKRFGIQVPITVYEHRSKFTIIDGERRWRCATKLNFKKIPALIQPKPTALENLLLMFNIHALREDWDYFTIASKLPNVISLFAKENGDPPNEIQLSEITGLTRGQIRRCRYLLDLPDRYKILLTEELSLPKQRQQLSEDFFIEMERSLKTVQNRVPSAVTNLDGARDALIDKFRRDVIGNVTDFRMLSKIATSVENLGVREARARKAIKGIFSDKNDLGIADVYAEHFEIRYDEKKMVRSIESITEYLDDLSRMREDGPQISREIEKLLKKLGRLIDQLLEG